MKTRLDFRQKILNAIQNVDNCSLYFQPPETVKIEYPCIIYTLNDIQTDYADDNPYNQNKSYRLTIVDKNPDSNIPDKISKLQLCTFDRFYASDNLNHWVFICYD